jgi:hypothetical protein
MSVLSLMRKSDSGSNEHIIVCSLMKDLIFGHFVSSWRREAAYSYGAAKDTGLRHVAEPLNNRLHDFKAKPLDNELQLPRHEYTLILLC